tara:strand:- start:5420 stop:5902 length:483 start_codon:yes stop_codon:yes gene_type:complete
MSKFRSHFAVSKYLLALANETGTYLSNLKLQKLLYYFQAWFYAYSGQKLFDSDFQAWVHGPVIPESYHNYKKFGYHPIVDETLGQDVIKNFKSKFNHKELNFLTDIESYYMSKTGYELERLSHNEEPWRIARKGIPDDQPSEETITLESMKEYYSKYISE